MSSSLLSQHQLHSNSNSSVNFAGNVQDQHRDDGKGQTATRRSLISHPSSAFRPVKPSKKVQQQQQSQQKSNSKFYREKPFFADIKAIARGFGEIIEFPEHIKGKRDRCAAVGDEVDQKQGEKYSAVGPRMPDDLTKASNGARAKERKIRKRPERRATVQEVETSFRQEEASKRAIEERLSPGTDEDMSSSTVNDVGKMERIRKYKEERRKQLAAQSTREPRRSAR